VYCPSCGADNAGDGASCANCGRGLPGRIAAERAPLPPLAPSPSDFAHARDEVARGERHRRTLSTSTVVMAALGAVALLGFATRAALPAYQSYAIRSQIDEGLVLAAPYQAAVVAEWVSSGHSFAGIRSGSITSEVERQGRYVEAVDVVSGAIVITYGRSAHTSLQGRVLTIVPTLDAARRSVDWQCGRGPAAEGFEAIFEEPSRLTDVPDDYLPAACRRP
jgi:Tfp pilus assembly major pilin PilA